MSKKTPLLIVDDDIGMLETLTDILEEYGYEVTTASSGQEAVGKCLDNGFNLVLMDIRMGGMDGVEAMKEIKKFDPSISVVLMTAYTLEEVISDAYCGGARYVIRKPFKIDDVLPILSSARKALKILVIEDDESMASLLEKTLIRAGHVVSIAVNGKEAMKLIDSCEYDVALIDMILPDMNGMGIYDKLVAEHQKVRPVLMTGYTEQMKEKMEKAFDEKAYACLYKPFGIGELQKIVTEICLENTPQ